MDAGPNDENFYEYFNGSFRPINESINTNSQPINQSTASSNAESTHIQQIKHQLLQIMKIQLVQIIIIKLKHLMMMFIQKYILILKTLISS